MIDARESLTFLEVDIPYGGGCTYGIAPCQAAIGVTGDRKCLNVRPDCQDPEHFALTYVTLRYAVPSAYLAEGGIEAIPIIESVSMTPTVISLGEKRLGIRAELRVTLNDIPWSDTGEGYDKYVAERGYDPFKTGSYWGKFRARHPLLRGRAMRLIQGFVGQTLAEMETRHFVIESTDGPAIEDGSFTFLGQDVLKLADGKRAQAPRLSPGYLLADITATATSMTVGPTGVGASYPSSGFTTIGSTEIVQVTGRTGDTLTIVRGQKNTEAVAHDAQDRVQVCLDYVGEDPADIIADLLENYAGIPSSYIPVAAWKAETDAYLRRVYTATIAEPTDVNLLVSELIEQAALTIYPDDESQRLRLQVLREIPTDAATWGDETILEDTLDVQDQPNKRITNCATWFGIKNPLLDVDDPQSYHSVEATDQTDTLLEPSPTYKFVRSRWIPQFGRNIAARLNAIQLGRYLTAPRRFRFELFRDGVNNPRLGVGYRIMAWVLQEATGLRESVPIQITSIEARGDRFVIEAEEVRFVTLDEEDLTNRVVIIEGSAFNLNLRSIHDSLFPAEITEGVTVTFIINEGVIVGSNSTATPAIVVGDWSDAPSGFKPKVVVNGRVQGAGAPGGNGTNSSSVDGSPGLDGGPAFFTDQEIDIEYGANAEIFGGAGGGGGGGGGTNGGGGGGGAGAVPGIGGAPGAVDAANVPSQPGTTEAGGAGGIPPTGIGANGTGGAGGAPGMAGSSGNNGKGSLGGAGGDPGPAIDGASFLNVLSGSADIRGATIN